MEKDSYYQGAAIGPGVGMELVWALAIWWASFRVIDATQEDITLNARES
jgi:hypothetical protein